ncbi:MAG TPA: hypothetical protein VG055_34365 [Planctomycetaceae bacterium]|jgi:hypothetical protein|nr:hypothetical protein [Planctomycetaceae bacterium]
MSSIVKCLASLTFAIAAISRASTAFAAEDGSLIELAEAKFGKLGCDGKKHLDPVDLELFSKTAIGAVATFPVSRDLPGSDPTSFLPASRRTVRADRLQWLFTDTDAFLQVTENGVQIRGAFLARDATETAIDFSRIRIPFPVVLSKCTLSSQLILHHCEVRALDLSGSRIAGLFADGIKVDEDVALQDGFQTSHPILMNDATIGRRLRCNRAHLDRGSSAPPVWLKITKTPFGVSAAEPALEMRNAMVKGTVTLGEGFYSRGDIQLSGATIDGNLDCSQGAIDEEPGFKCDGQLDLRGATIKLDLICDNAVLNNPTDRPLSLELATVNGNALLRKATCQGEVKLLNATIRGNLEFDSGTFENPNGEALWMSGIHVNGNLLLRNGSTCRGIVDLLRATVGSSVICDGSTFDSPGGDSLVLELADIHGNLLLRKAMCRGTVNLLNASVHGNVDCDKATFNHPVWWLENIPLGGTALWMESIHVGGRLDLRNECTCHGFVDLSGATVGGVVDCREGRFDNPNQQALRMGLADVKGAVDLTGAICHGDVDLSESTIRGSLFLDGAALDQPKENPLALVLAQVHGAVSFRKGFRKGLREPFNSQGHVNMYGATVDKLVDCTEGQFNNPAGTALTLDLADIKGDVILNDAVCTGEVRLQNATVHGDLNCKKAQFINDVAERAALLCDGIRVAGSMSLEGKTNIKGKLSLVGASVERSLVCKDLQSTEELFIDFRAAQVGALLDDRDGWPPPGRLRLEDFKYGELGQGAPATADQRITWLHLQATQGDDGKPLPLSTQPYNQLAAVLRKQGHDGAARDILVHKEKDSVDPNRRNVGYYTIGFWNIAWNIVYRFTVGYGHRPWLAGLWALGLFVVGGVLFSRACDSQMMMRLKKDSVLSFSPWVYSLETLIPLIKLEQQECWGPDADTDRFFTVGGIKVTGRRLRRYQWTHIVLGWLLAAALLAGLSGLLHTP